MSNCVIVIENHPETTGVKNILAVREGKLAQDLYKFKEGKIIEFNKEIGSKVSP